MGVSNNDTNPEDTMDRNELSTRFFIGQRYSINRVKRLLAVANSLPRTRLNCRVRIACLQWLGQW